MIGALIDVCGFLIKPVGEFTLALVIAACLILYLLKQRKNILDNTGEDPARNMGLKILSGFTTEMQYMCIVDCNVLLIHVK